MLLHRVRFGSKWVGSASKKIGSTIGYLLFLLVWIGDGKIAISQSVIPATDGTGTIVTPNGNQFSITGGQFSRDGTNLFHSFQQFGLDQNQVVTFLSNPAIQNILGRVVGGNPSIVNGLIQVTGSNANLYLINPAGIVFGSTASLNVPGSLTATTASSVGFGNQWFNATGTNDYANLIGSPTTLAFAMNQPGAIVNAGNLAVELGQTLNLVGGTVVNTGSLTAPGGQIIVTAVPGSNLVRLNQSGSLLSLEIAPLSTALPLPPDPPSLAQLLTGGNLSNATGLQVNATGQVELTRSPIPVNPGDVVAYNVTAQTATLSANHNLTLVESRLQTTGDLNLLAANTVLIRDSPEKMFIAHAGGNLYIQGNQSIDILTLNHLQQGTPFQSGGNLSLVSNGNISGDAHFASGKQFSILNLFGQPGNFVSLYDPIISANGDVQFGDYTGVSLKVEATGSIVGGNITITGPDTALVSAGPDTVILRTSPSLILRAGLSTLTNPPNIPQLNVATVPTDFLPFLSGLPAGSIQVGDINADGSNGSNAGSIILNATGNITTGELRATIPPLDGEGRGGNVFLNSGGDITITGNLATFSRKESSGDITLVAQGDLVINCTASSFCVESFTNATTGVLAGNINFTSHTGAIIVSRTSSGEPLFQSFTRGNGKAGDITLSARNGINTTAGLLNSAAPLGIAGNIILSTTGNITTGAINSTGSLGGGSITLTSTAGSINTTGGKLDSSSNNRNGGLINFTASEDITAGEISSVSANGVGGAITLNGNNITLNSQITLGSETGQGGGALLLNTTGNVQIPATILSNGANVSGKTPLSLLFGLSTGSTINTNGGDLSLAFASDAKLGNVSILTAGGAIALTSAGDLTTTGDLNTASTTGAGGDITLTSQTGGISTSNLNASGVSQGGNVEVQARTQITAGAIDTSATIGNGGNVTLDPIGDIRVTSINAQGGSAGSGGNVDITTESFFRATGRFFDRNNQFASISTAGGISGGDITIRHGGQGITPFIIGNASVNGTAGVLTTGSDNIIALGNQYYFTYTQPGLSGTMRIISVDPVSPPEKDPLEQLDKSLRQPCEIENSIVCRLEEYFTRQYDRYFNRPNTPIKTLSQIQQELRDIERKTGVKPALIYVIFTPVGLRPDDITNQVKADQEVPPDLIWHFTAQGLSITNSGNRQDGGVPFKIGCKSVSNPIKQSSEQSPDPCHMELVLVTSDVNPILRRSPNSPQSVVVGDANDFRSLIRDSGDAPREAKQFYNWLLAPLEADLRRLGVDNLVFIMDSGLRTLPLAAIRQERFLLDDYSVGMMPSMSLTDTRYVSVKKAQPLLMGASQFTSKNSLPAVPVELSMLHELYPDSKIFLNEAFTKANLASQRQNFQLIHLATHGSFQPGDFSNSYILLGRDRKLSLEEIQQFGWTKPPVELLVLSACETATGSEEAELGFAGAAVQAGVKTSLASLWAVSDSGTVPLMAEFYSQLQTAPIKAEALRRAQNAIRQNQWKTKLMPLFSRVQEKSVLSPEGLMVLDNLRAASLDRPSYWATFTLIGNPW